MSTRSKKRGRGPRPAKPVKRPPSVAPARHALDPNAPGLDEETRQRRRVLARLRQMSLDELDEVMIRAGIFTEDGQLTEPYRNDEPSASRPTD